ncbi:MAG: hypothetical protein NZ849_10510 [Meiothermus sp.]|uniref:hypothetical protein n=1 Tax=Meiothermus sp. TaxID=1955249 RepID=UPI0025E28942|nr:hypothetical protein [Meiothermus sp.]MCS7058481.1 hypothetical protein [Meiothermus sp.]MCS7195321.1 hypothetical protein [Meiothermus sp.]MCX7740519.1 hypothetical protein [Meiothermus sp.]MDW8091666.1 hypothetical protein [Meiothermus sp.]MDW8480982.1 hypothetical protein [Meiothermus sp.]
MNNHQRVLGLALAELEGFLLRLERAFAEPPLSGQLYWETNPLFGHPKATTVQAESARLRGHLARLAQLLGLEPVRKSRFDFFWAGLSSYWANLEELRPVHLESYGRVEPWLAATLEPELEALEQGLRQIESYLMEVEDVPAHRGGV